MEWFLLDLLDIPISFYIPDLTMMKLDNRFGPKHHRAVGILLVTLPLSGQPFYALGCISYPAENFIGILADFRSMPSYFSRSLVEFDRITHYFYTAIIRMIEGGKKVVRSGLRVIDDFDKVLGMRPVSPDTVEDRSPFFESLTEVDLF